MRTALGLAALLAATGITVLSAGSTAHAAPHYFTAPSIQIGHTDSATPDQAYDWVRDVNMPIGSRTDESGSVHTSRVYATFDLTQLHGKRIVAGKLLMRETEVSDCTKRAIEVWRTHQIHRTPSWDKAPKPTDRLDEIRTAQYCPANLTFDVDGAVVEAVRQGKEKISFEIRVPDEFEADPAYARKLYWYTTVSLSVRYNSLPAIDDHHMYHGGQRCDGTTTPRLNERAGWLQGMVSDADPHDERYLTTEFAVWPQDDPSARRVYTTTHSVPARVASVGVPSSELEDGRAYSWQYRTNDGADTTAWSRVCSVLVDTTRPGAPGVSSTNYPPADSGQSTPLGEPGVFTFSGGGDPDIVGFQWGFDILGVNTCSIGSGDVGQHECTDIFSLPRTVRANAPGGNATALINPDRIARNRLLVRSIDAAGNTSGETVYEFNAPWRGEPTASVVGHAIWGRPLTLKLSPGAGISGTTRYEYQLDHGPKQVLDAGADGTATFTFPATNEYGHQVTFRSFSANGWVSPQAAWEIHFGPWPMVVSDIYTGWDPVGGVGVPGTFTFLPPAGWTEVKGYQYAINGAEPRYLDATPDGTASLTWAPQVSGWNYFDVWAVRPDGTVGDYSGSYWFNVAE
ncbi:hypothetical protein [Allorhizocola rhizosphaerae]|uniref:hypothetical protein n=1 Tax=Allorhizocola rhizosphaerae TaxID=1872709 RepID=UPI000E3BD8B6|nr:hypothetical protein [Allorhizocola rhizosphaerae]